jgi:hypothetical protein
MALAKTVTKMFPTKNHVGIHLLLTDDDRADIGPGQIPVIDADFTENFTRGQGVTNPVRDSIGKKAQEAIDEYKECRATYDAAAYDTAVSQIDNTLDIS